MEGGVRYERNVTPHHRRYLLLEQGIGAALFNLVLNAGIAWAMFRGMSTVPLWGQQSIMGDTVGTSLVLPLMTCLIVTRLARGHVRSGRIAALGWTRTDVPWLGWLPRRTVARALTLAAACVLLLAPIAALALRAAGVTEMSPYAFVAFKAVFAAVAAALVTPVVALWAIAE
jgi:hypothetical protein